MPALKTPSPSSGVVAPVTVFKVELPAGGPMHLQTADEVDLWQRAYQRYMEQYVIDRHNDLVTLGALLQQQVILYRCQVAINGMEPETDAHGVPTGSYRRIEQDAGELAAYQKTLVEAAKEMRALEKQLGIDKATRESGGAHTVDSFLSFLKKAAHARGVHIVEMVLEYQRVFNEASWKLRMLYHADKEDRAYHDITPKTVLDWLYGEIAQLQAKDKEWSKDVGRLYVGQL